MNDIPIDPQIPAHDRIYRKLRNDIMYGAIAPGQAITIRGLAESFGLSMTPAREAVRRLTAEGALSMSKTGRVTTPRLGTERIEELASLRALLEPEMGARALPRAHLALIDRLQNINEQIDLMIQRNDAQGYIQRNLEFHRTLYLRAQAPAMLAMVETVWLQLGPTMNALYIQLRRKQASDNHRKIIGALRAGDEPSLRLSIRADVTQGLQMLVT